MPTRELIPIIGCLVKRKEITDMKCCGIVTKTYASSSVKIHWANNEIESIHHIDELNSAFRLGMGVIIPSSTDGEKLGDGIIIQYRSIAGQQMYLVEFYHTSEKRWIPYQLIRQHKDVKHEFVTLNKSKIFSAERLRMRTLAYAITVWNENTGALSNLNIDPLPHQIHLVHHILNSDNRNWLIADDVGLGKTVEAILLMSALQHRKQLNSVLLITPAGLTQQWQEEIISKAPNLPRFNIYGHDFLVKNNHHWLENNYVIASMDRLKDKEHLNVLLDSRKYDLIIVDEAHRLSRRQYGYKLDSSERFDLVAELRKQSPSVDMIFLSATPHQGMQDKFVALLELLRPDRREDLLQIELTPDILSEMVFRNYKADVTDFDGNFVFFGKSVHSIEVESNEHAIEFDKSLREYLKRGYSAGKALGRTGNAIGFVMTVYRKLAASSVSAIHTALQRRLVRLQNEMKQLNKVEFSEDSPFEGEFEEASIKNTSHKEFFEGEIELLKDLIVDAKELLLYDNKAIRFIDTVVEQIMVNNPKEKVLIFTEYRSTQSYLKEQIKKRFGEGKTSLIFGGMTLEERRKQIATFETEGLFLISTEAGGEGINLQDNCHIMINYDLPWNPMRLVQRVGRLYRYGQKNKVVVFNLNSSGSADEQILETMYDRVESVVKDLVSVQSSEYNDALMDDILGEVSSLVDIQSIIENSQDEGVERTKERIDEAVDKAKKSAELQRDLFQYAINSNITNQDNKLNITKEHVVSFVAGMCNLLNIEIVNKIHDGQVWQLRIPVDVMQKLETRKSRHDISFDRKIANKREGTQYVDLDSYLMKLFISFAKKYSFKGKVAHINSNVISEDAFMACLLSWQNGLGVRRKQDFAILSTKNGEVIENSAEVVNWLLEPAQSLEGISSCLDKKEFFKLTQEAAENKLNSVSSRHTFPEQIQWISAAIIN